MKPNLNSLTKINTNAELFALVGDRTIIVRINKIGWLAKEYYTDIIEASLDIARNDTEIINKMGVHNVCRDMPSAFVQMETHHRDNDMVAVPLPVGRLGSYHAWFSVNAKNLYSYSHNGNDYLIQAHGRDGNIESIAIYLLIK